MGLFHICIGNKAQKWGRKEEDESYLHDFAVLERNEKEEGEEGRKDEMGKERMKDHPPQPKKNFAKLLILGINDKM